MVAPAIEHPELETCDECGSAFVPAASRMASLCPECAHWLYGYPNCTHDMQAGRCAHCGWDGSHSVYVENIKAERENAATAPDAGPEGDAEEE